MKIIFGLGNPGRQYENNRHNVGYMVAESLASENGLTFKRSFRISAYIAKKKDPQGWIFLVKPRTFMNRSGLCVKKSLGVYKVSGRDALIIYDDVDLPFGVIRFRGRGSCAGHRGMVSVISALGGAEINRLRIGIGSTGGDTSSYVLSDFVLSEKETLDKVIQEAKEASWEWADKGIDFVMQKYNRRGG